MWKQDQSNDPELIAALRAHSRQPDLVVYVGEGWLPLVRECHERLARAFPGYELLAVKQKFGRLAYQAVPQRWHPNKQGWSANDWAALHAIISELCDRSETICENCGAAGRLRDQREIHRTLCGPCDEAVPDRGDIWAITRL